MLSIKYESIRLPFYGASRHYYDLFEDMVKLEKFLKSDYGQLIEWISNEDIMTTWSGALFSFPLTADSLDWYIEDTNVAGESDAFVYKVVEDTTGKTVGHISIGGISWKNRSARISRVFLAESERGKGYCAGMIMAALKVGFDELGLHRIGLGLYDNNPAALNCYKKCGFSVEGLSRDILWNNGKWWSMIEMSILEPEWKLLSRKEPVI